MQENCKESRSNDPVSARLCSKGRRTLRCFLSQETGNPTRRRAEPFETYTRGSCLRRETRSGPLSGRGLEARKRFTVASSSGSSDSSGTLFYANRVSFFLVSRRVLAAEEESTLTPRVAFITISQMQSVPGN